MPRQIKLEDYLHKTFNRLTVTGLAKVESGRSYFIASCSCGQENVKVYPYQLGEQKKSCGCLKSQPNIVNPEFNLAGQVFGNLTVRSLVANSEQSKKTKNRRWLCDCSCGNSHIASSNNLKSGNTKSCGCINHLPHNKKFGEFRSKVYDAWKNAKVRCYDDDYSSTEKYKGRGIYMSEEFLNDFDVFYTYIGDPPSEEHTLERLDVNGNYERGNLAWVLMQFQARNKTKLKNNTSGVTGVSWKNDKGKLHAVASWRQFDESSQRIRIKSKSFSADKYGEELAFQLACSARQEAIESLNKLGYGYSDNHGK